VAGTSEYYYGQDEPFTLVNAFVLCIDRPGEVTLTDVRFAHNVGDLRVDDFAVAPHGTLRDDQPEDAPKAALSEWGFDSDPPVVATVCPDELTEEESQRFIRSRTRTSASSSPSPTRRRSRMPTAGVTFRASRDQRAPPSPSSAGGGARRRFRRRRGVREAPHCPVPERCGALAWQWLLAGDGCSADGCVIAFPRSQGGANHQRRALTARRVPAGESGSRRPLASVVAGASTGTVQESERWRSPPLALLASWRSADRAGSGGAARQPTRPCATRPKAGPFSMVKSWVCGLRWVSFWAPATRGSLRFQMNSPRRMSAS
jgi:hypothetical protein